MSSILFNSKNIIAMVLVLLCAGLAAESNPPVTPVTQESFFIKMPLDAIAVTGGEHAPLLRFPENIVEFKEKKISRGLVVVGKLRNSEDEIIGFASELEVFPFHARQNFDSQNVIWDTSWTLVIPDRGMLFLFQQEHSGELARETMGRVRETGEDWNGDKSMTTTVGPAANGRGIIIGGTGEFKNIKGSFIENNRMTRFTTTGDMHIDVEIKLFFH
jgi:hypothetical protein